MMRVLFIEDDPDQVFLYSKRFELDNIKVFPASSSGEAFRILDTVVPDVILLDVLLGSENGLDILEKLKNHSASQCIPVIIFTNYEKEAIKRHSSLRLANEFLMKLRVTPDQLLEEITKVLNSKEINK